MPAPIILPDPTAATGVTRWAYRRLIGRELGRFVVLTTTSAPSGTPDAPRQVFVSSLRSDDQPPSRLDGLYLYVVNGAQAGSQRRVVGGSWTSQFGHLFVDAPFASALATGTEIELCGPLPSDYHLENKGLNQVVVEALARCLIETRLALTGNGTRSVSLLSYPYAVLSDQVDAILERSVSTDPYEVGANEGRIAADGVDLTLVLETLIASGTAFQARILRDGSTLVKTGGTWAYSTTGPTSDTDEAAVPLHWIRAFGTLLALRAAIEVIEEDPTISDAVRDRRIARYQRRIPTYARAAARIIREEFPRATPRRKRGMIGGILADQASVSEPVAAVGWP